MKHLIIVFSALCITAISYGQFQVSVSSGYAISSAGMKLGEKMNTTQTENTYGSYGEGTNIQVRGTYFFNDKFGLDLALGYLNGADQTVSEVSTPTIDVDAIARARAFGAGISMVYNFNENFYGRLGALLKVGGKTEAVVYNNSALSADQIADFNAAGLPVTTGAYSETNYVEDYHGHFPLGVVAALGYTYDLDTHFSLFVEAEYYGISLKRKDSEIAEFNTDIFYNDGTIAIPGYNTLDNLPDGYFKDTTYVDELSHADAATDGSKKLSQKVPYSSFGLNFGLTYKFDGSSKK